MPYDLPSISFERAQKALSRGAVASELPIAFCAWGGTGTYTHTICTVRGTLYKVNSRVARALNLPGTASAAASQTRRP